MTKELEKIFDDWYVNFDFDTEVELDTGEKLVMVEVCMDVDEFVYWLDDNHHTFKNGDDLEILFEKYVEHKNFDDPKFMDEVYDKWTEENYVTQYELWERHQDELMDKYVDEDRWRDDEDY